MEKAIAEATRTPPTQEPMMIPALFAPLVEVDEPLEELLDDSLADLLDDSLAGSLVGSLDGSLVGGAGGV